MQTLTVNDISQDLVDLESALSLGLIETIDDAGCACSIKHPLEGCSVDLVKALDYRLEDER